MDQALLDHSDAEARALAVSPDGSAVFVTGASTARRTADYATVAYDASTGRRLWARATTDRREPRTWPTRSDEPEGSLVFVTGYEHGKTSGYDYTTVAYDASTGEKAVGDPVPRTANETKSSAAHAVGVSPDGSSVFVTGRATDRRPATATPRWPTTHPAATSCGRGGTPDGGFPREAARDLGVSPDGSSVFVTGSARDTTALSDYATVAYDATTGASCGSSATTVRRTMSTSHERLGSAPTARACS